MLGKAQSKPPAKQVALVGLHLAGAGLSYTPILVSTRKPLYGLD